MKFVKIPTAFLDIIVSGKKIDDVLAGKSEVQRGIINGLIVAFKCSSDHTAGDINDLIEICVAETNSFSLPLNCRQRICDVLEQNLEEIYGIDCSEYLDDLKPRLLAGRERTDSMISNDIVQALSALDLKESKCLYVDSDPRNSELSQDDIK